MNTLTPSFDRFEVEGLTSYSAIASGYGGGIYLLEFADGTQYVGQAKNFARRLYQHRHGSRMHHEPWTDITAINLMTTPTDVATLNYWERSIIESKRAAGQALRNKTFNLGYVGESPLDADVPVTTQQHWATGQGSYDLAKVREAAYRPRHERPKIYQEEPQRADAVIACVATILGAAVPDVVDLEGKWWTLSDAPRTGFKRFTTLNVANFELAWSPRRPVLAQVPWMRQETDEVHFNLPLGTIWRGTRLPSLRLNHMADPERYLMPDGRTVWVGPARYASTWVDTVIVQTPDFLDGFAGWDLEVPLRRLALDVMRSRSSRIVSRFHSHELATRAYLALVM